MKKYTLLIIFIIFILIDVGILFNIQYQQKKDQTSKITPILNTQPIVAQAANTPIPEQPVLSFVLPRLQNSQKNPQKNLLSRFFIFLDTKTIAINKISFTLQYNKNEIDSHSLLILPQPIFPSQTVTSDVVKEPSTNNIVRIRYAIVNKNTQQPKSFGQGVVIVNFANLHSPETVTFTLSDISYTNAENQVVTLPNYTQSYTL